MSSDEPPKPTPWPPPAPVYQWPREPTPVMQQALHFLIGIGLGLIPLAFGMIGLGWFYHPHDASIVGTFLGAGIGLYVLEFTIMAVLVIRSDTRLVGLGVLTALAADLVIFFLGCFVAIMTGPPF
ncbi:MAG TPA: hypothetical protein VGR57_02360 [Ktedonobacterales bacterium]|nr:hypothetical protein [Ktedonobacterales bacterium]